MHENMDTAGLVIRNNICSDNHSFQIAIEGPDPGSVTADHNLIDGFQGYPGEIYGTDYQEGDPLFVSTASDDLHLQSGSIAIDNGSAVDAPADDFDGTQRPQGAGWDIGAYEYGSTIFADGFESGDTTRWSVSVP